jgi:hypothetical protein
MLFGHAAVASLGQQYFFRRAGLPFCLVAAFGPDWIDKPLKLVFGFSGHGVAHSLIGSVVALTLVWLACRRLALPESWPAAVVLLWAAHLVCDWVGPRTLFWPFAGSFPVNPASSAELAWQFYFSRPLIPLAWCDIVLTLVAVAARFRPALRLASH